MAKNLFKARANYVFDYKPRYYDERKERLDNLEKKYKKNENENEESESVSSTISATNLRKEWKRSKHVAHDKKTNLRLAMIITILVGIAVYVFDLHKIML